MFYKESSFLLQKLELIISGILLLLSLLILQALIIQGQMRGYIGALVVEFVTPFIGIVGAWLFWLMTFLVAVTIVLDDKINFMKLLYNFRQKIKDKKLQKKVQTKLKEASKEEKSFETIPQEKKPSKHSTSL